MNPMKRAGNKPCERWLAIALCTAGVSIGVASSAHADDAAAPSVPAATLDDATPEPPAEVEPPTVPDGATPKPPAEVEPTTVPDGATPPVDGTAPPPVTPKSPAPDGFYIANVTANGTGCPAGTWDSSIAPNGDMNVTFSSFEDEVHRSSMVSVSDCQLNIAIHAPRAVSFAVRDIEFHGYAFLEDGVALRQVANYYFSGTPDANAEARVDLTGPYDDTFLFTDVRKDLDLVFSPCGKVRNLQVRLTSRVLNSSNPRRNGYVNIDKVRISAKNFAYKVCDELVAK